jgi:hypothetical protein
MKKSFLLCCHSIFLSCVLLFATYQTSLGQENNFLPGFVLTLNNDTIRGLVQFKDRSFNSDNCVFKEASNSNPKTYKPGEIKSYSIGNKGNFYSHNVSTDVQMRNVFLECIVKGKVSLYNFDDRFFMESGGRVKDIVVTKSTARQGDKVYTMDLPVYKGLLQTEMNDCPTIHQNISNTGFTKKELTQLFIDYHKCIGEDFTTFESETGKIKVRFGLAVGFVASFFDLNSGGDPSFTYIDSKDPLQDKAVTPSFLMEFTVSGKKNKLRIRSGLSYYSNEYHIYDENSAANLGHSLTVEYARIEVPVLLKYYPLKSNQGLYTLAGLGFNGVIQWEDKQVVTVPPLYILSETSSLENNKYFTNILAGLGFEFKITGKPFFAEASYGWGPLVLSRSNPPSAVITGFTFSTGLLF